MNALVVLPTFNEAANLEAVCRGVLEAVPEAEILVVDDGSPDGTADLAARLADELGRIHLLRRHHKQGLGKAYLAGFAWALERDYDAILEMDADLSHEPATVPLLIERLSVADLVIGSRYMAGGSIPKWGLSRRLLSHAGNSYSSWMLGLEVRDLTSGFRCFRADLLRRLPLGKLHANGYGFQIEMAYRAMQAGAEILEVPIRFIDRREGESKMSLWIAAEAMAMVTAAGVLRGWAALASSVHARTHRRCSSPLRP